MSRVVRRLAASVLSAAVLALAVAGMAAAQTLPKVKLWGASATVEAYHGFLYLGNPLGFFKEQGVEVEFGTAAGSGATIQLLGAGQVDMGYVSMELLMLAKAKNPQLPVTAVYLHDRGNIYELIVPVDSPITKVEDIKGKKIGVANLASGGVPFTKSLAKSVGLDPEKDIELLPVGNGGQALVALTSGRVHALSLFRAQHALLETLGQKFRYFQRESPSAIIAVNSNFLKSNEEAVVKVLRGVAQATAFAEANPNAAVNEFLKLFGKPQGLSEEEARKRGAHIIASTSQLWKDYKDTTVKWGDINDRHWKIIEDNLTEQQLLTTKVPFPSLYSAALIERVNTVDISAAVRLASEYKAK